MRDHFLLIEASFGYFLSSIWGAYALGAKKPISTKWNSVLFFVSFLLHTLFLHERGKITGHCPISNPFEIAIFFSWSLALTYLVIGPVFRMSILGAFTAPMVFLINFAALASPIDYLNPTFSLNWKVEMHASLILLGFGTLGIAALAGLMYLIQERQLKQHHLHSWFYRLPAMGQLEIVHRRVLLWAFLLFSAGMLTGFFIPQTHKSDSLKIGWSAVVWIFYSILLFIPKALSLSHKKVAWLSVGGYVFILLTFWGISSISANEDHLNSSVISEKNGVLS